MKQADGKKLAWNGGTGVLVEHRGKGIAKAMMLEAGKLIREQEVDLAFLEVVVKNEHAVEAYKKGGFKIVDRMIGMTHAGDGRSFIDQSGSLDRVRLEFGTPFDVAKLPFYRSLAAWGCMWHNMKKGESLIAIDAEGRAVGYALFNRAYGENGELRSVTLQQCEGSEECKDKSGLFRMLLSEVYGSFRSSCTYRTSDLSMSNPEVVTLLQEAGFITNYEQYLMVMDKADYISRD
jgi:hypothetical protein